MEVHHVRPVRTFDDPSDAHGLDNLVTLCRPCHRAVEYQGATVAETTDSKPRKITLLAA